MKAACHLGFVAILAALLVSPASAQVQLGRAPTLPKDFKFNPPPTNAASPESVPIISGFTVNTDSREQVRDFYNGIFHAMDNEPMNTFADVPSCTPGGNSLVFIESVALRINWYRAMAGIPANIVLDPAYNTGDQAAAEIISANGVLNHNPPPSDICYSDLGHQYSGGSDLSGGANGPDAVTDFIWDFGNGNNEVGHRRWILDPPTTTMGTGDFPYAVNNGVTNIAANAIYVFDPSIGNPRPATRQPYVAWPPEGYVPYQVTYPYWSFALSNADLSAVTITMKSNGAPISLVIEPQTNGFGENTVVWVPMGLDANCECTQFPFNGTDTVYNVTISNISTITGGVTNKTSFSYSVTVIDPAVAGGDYIAPAINGPAQATVGASNVYTVTAINNPNVTSYQWSIARLTNGYAVGNPNLGLGSFNFSPSPDYSVVDSAPDGSGSNCFHLCDDNGQPQILQLNEVLIPATNTTVKFSSLLGYATTDETARVQVSTNNGTNWSDVYTQPGCDPQGNGGMCETSFSPHTISLAAYANIPTLLRFNFDFEGGYFFPGDSDSPLGWSVESIIVTNTLQLVDQTTNLVATTNLVSGTFIDNAAQGLTNFTFTPSPNYPPTTSAPDGSGSNCFHLCDPVATSQFLQLDRVMLPAANTTLGFRSFLGYAATNETARVQVSTNNGTNWQDIFTEAGCDSGQCSPSFTPQTLSLASFAGVPTLLRFAYTFDCCSYYPSQTDAALGWCIENIVITNSRLYTVTIPNTTNFTFVPPFPGTYSLQVTPVIYDQFTLTPGPVRTITAVSSAGIVMNDPVLAGTNVQLNFTVTGGLSGTFRLLQAAKLGSGWTTNSAATLTTNTPGSSYRFTTTNGSSPRFYRVQLTPGS